jgi:hypothetical protein
MARDGGKDQQDVESVYDMTDDVTRAGGYTFESRVARRNSNGWGGTQTKLPAGHLARRDTEPSAKRLKPGKK